MALSIQRIRAGRPGTTGSSGAPGRWAARARPFGRSGITLNPPRPQSAPDGVNDPRKSRPKSCHDTPSLVPGRKHGSSVERPGIPCTQSMRKSLASEGPTLEKRGGISRVPRLMGRFGLALAGVRAHGGSEVDEVPRRMSCSDWVLSETMASFGGGVASLAGLDSLWRMTTGDPRVLIAVLDGPVDLGHATFAGASLAAVGTQGRTARGGAATRHGTLVASLILGQPSVSSPVIGVAPGCRGLVVPIFHDSPGRSAAVGEGPPRASQIDLARAIALAVEQGAWIINVSAGEPSPSGVAHPLLASAVERAARRGVLIVAAVGNDGRELVHVPAALSNVLAVGAMDERGLPLASTNHGRRYRTTGLLALGSGLWGAVPGGGQARVAGTSFATAVVSGIAGLLASAALERGVRLNGARLREILLDSAQECLDDPGTFERCLAGRLDLTRAVSMMIGRELSMSDEGALPVTGERFKRDPGEGGGERHAAGVVPSSAAASGGCGCASCQAKATGKGCGCASCQATKPARGGLVFALGQIGYDLVSEARRDSIRQHMTGSNPNPHDPGQMLDFLEKNAWESASITWTLNFDQTPLYAIVPTGPFAARSYELLREFLKDQTAGLVERVSIPGRIGGQARLLNGQVVPFVIPEPRGMFSWTTGALVKAVVGEPPATTVPGDQRAAYERKADGVRGFLQKVYHELRNLGVTAEERAINYAATNAFQLERISESLLSEAMELDSVEVERSPICRPESDCWDVKILFFYPERQVPSLRKVFRFTVDVSDVVPVAVGPMRSWSVR